VPPIMPRIVMVRVVHRLAESIVAGIAGRHASAIGVRFGQRAEMAPFCAGWPRAR
jgi:hypothetical protein